MKLFKSGALSLLSILLSANVSFAADPILLDLYLGGKLQQHISLLGPNSGYKFWPADASDTVLELKLIAPEPIIVDLNEKHSGVEIPGATGRIKLIEKGSSISISEINGTAFQHPYVFIRPE